MAIIDNIKVGSTTYVVRDTAQYQPSTDNGDTLVANGTDLNTLTTAGVYYQPNSDQTTNTTNKPPMGNVAFVMEVKGTIGGPSDLQKKYVCQYWRTYGSTTTAGMQYYRTTTHGIAWSPWVRVITSQNIQVNGVTLTIGI